MTITDTIRAAAADAEASNRLPVLAAGIKDALMRGAIADYDLCVALAEAKAAFPSNRDFSEWCKMNDIKMEKNERAAAIELGGNPDLRKLLAENPGASLRKIQSLVAVPKTGKSNRSAKPRRLTPEFDKAQAVYDRRKAAGESLGMTAIAKEAGTSDTPVRRVLEIAREEEASDRVEDLILSGSAQEKFDAKLRAHQKKLDLDFETAVQKESAKRSEELALPHYFKVLKEVKSWLETRIQKGGILSRKEFVSILACLHPDSNGRSKERLEEAFILFKKHEDMIVMDKAAPRIAEIYDMPKNREEMMARRKKHI